MPPDAKIQRKNLHDELARLIRIMIIERQLVPGKRIPERALCMRFGVSRTPLRDALKVLSVEGLVRLSPNRGAVVMCITREQADDVIGLLGALEAFAGAPICKHIDDTRIAMMRAQNTRMMEHIRQDEKQLAVELDRVIRRAAIEAAANGTLVEIHQMLEARLGSVLSAARRLHPHWGDIIDDNERMLAALEARDSNALAAFARERAHHLTRAVKEAFDIFEASRAKRASSPSGRRRRLGGDQR
jgi:DNA-binding GntR family transcriptional regulator